MAPLFSLLLVALLACSFQQTVVAFTSLSDRSIVSVGIARSSHNLGRSSSHNILSSSNGNNSDEWDEDWDLGDSSSSSSPREVDPRVDAMRSILESSWDDTTMGVVPSGPEKAAEAAAESVADAMGQSKNVLMVDLRLPSYDITEGSKMYDIMAAYDFCSYLSDNLRERNLIRKSLVLVRNEKERAEIDRIKKSQRPTNSAPTAVGNTADDDIGRDDDSWEASEEGGSEVDDFRKQLMSSWDATPYEPSSIPVGEGSKAQSAPAKKVTESDDSSHRLWSIVGGEEISTGPDMFEQVIAAADQNAILSADEDALIILSPYDTTDVIGLRRIMARYGQTRTIIIVNSRIEQLPRELDPAVLVYGILPLIAVSKRENESSTEAGLKAVVMKRFPADWSVFVDVYGDGFVETKAGMQYGGTDKQFPSPEWIAQRVQAHVESLPKQ